MASLPFRINPLAFVRPCLPCVALQPPSGEGWLHEVKHPGLRIEACRDGNGVKLFAQSGEDWTERFPYLAEAVRALPAKSCIIDGELVGCDEQGNTPLGGQSPEQEEDNVAVNVSYYVFDLLEVNGFDLRRDGIEDRKRALQHLLLRAAPILRFNPHFEQRGEAVFRQACRMGFEGVVSKRRGSQYQSGRSSDWLYSRRIDQH